MSWQRTKIQLPKQFGPIERQAIAQEVIDFIVKRSQSGKDINNNPFPKYSSSYTNSLNFKIAGKSKAKVDLTLSSEMLNSIELLSHKSGEILVGFDKADKELNGKAAGNQLGTYGKSSPIRGKARPFLGISDKDLQSIVKKYQSNDQRAEKVLSAASEADSLASGIEFDPEN